MFSPSLPHLSVSVALLTLLFCSASSGQDALQLFRKMQTALGGAEKIASVCDFEESVRADTWYSDGRPLGKVRKRTNDTIDSPVGVNEGNSQLPQQRL